MGSWFAEYFVNKHMWWLKLFNKIHNFIAYIINDNIPKNNKYLTNIYTHEFVDH